MTASRRGRHFNRGRYLPELLSELRPVRRPSLIVLLWRWRWELLLGLGVPVAATAAGLRFGWAWPLAAIGVVAGLLTAFPAARRWLAAHARCIITAHRIRAGCEQAWIQTRYGKLPAILLISPQAFGERAYLWCPAGISPADFAAASELLCAACWAADITVTISSRHRHIVILDIIHY
jgi:hypothetical protein